MSTSQNECIGLSSNNRDLLVGIFFAVLLLWGPVEPFGITIRIAYLLILPGILWFILKYLGNKWRAGDAENRALTRKIVAVIAVALLFRSYLSFTASSHLECTQSIQTREGSECVGVYINVPGRDVSGTIVSAILGSFAIWYVIKGWKTR